MKRLSCFGGKSEARQNLEGDTRLWCQTAAHTARLTTTKTTSTLGCILNAKKSMLSEQAVKSWPLEKYAKFVAPKETSSTHKQGYWKVCMLRIFKSKNLLCRRRVCG